MFTKKTGSLRKSKLMNFTRPEKAKASHMQRVKKGRQSDNCDLYQPDGRMDVSITTTPSDKAKAASGEELEMGEAARAGSAGGGGVGGAAGAIEWADDASEAVRHAFRLTSQALGRMEAETRMREQRCREATRDEMAALEQRLVEHLQIAVGAAEERLKGRVRKVEERVERLEERLSSSTEQEKAVANALEGCMKALEDSVRRAQESVFRDMEAAHLERVQATFPSLLAPTPASATAAAAAASACASPSVSSEAVTLMAGDTSSKTPSALGNKESPSSAPPPKPSPPTAKPLAPAESPPQPPPPSSQAAAPAPRAQRPELAKVLIDAAKSGKVEAVQKALETGVDVNARGVSHETALHWAALKGHADVVALLLVRGVDVNATEEKEERTALHCAASHDYSGRCASALIAGGARLDCVNVQGRTALHVAARWGNSSAVRALVEAHADTETRDSLGMRPRDLTSRESILRLLTQ